MAAFVEDCIYAALASNKQRATSDEYGGIMTKATIYTSNMCPACVMAKNFFKEKSIPYDELNINIDEAARDKMVQLTSQTGVPVIEYKGEVLVGFRPRTLEKLFNG